MIVQPSGAVRVPDHAHKTLDIGHKPRFTAVRSEIHLSPPKCRCVNLRQYLILPGVDLRLSDSVRLCAQSILRALRRRAATAAVSVALEKQRLADDGGHGG